MFPHFTVQLHINIGCTCHFVILKKSKKCIRSNLSELFCFSFYAIQVLQTIELPIFKNSTMTDNCIRRVPNVNTTYYDAVEMCEKFTNGKRHIIVPNVTYKGDNDFWVGVTLNNYPGYCTYYHKSTAN